MRAGLTIEYPTNTAQTDIKKIEEGVKGVASVKSVTPGTDRGLDVATISTIVSLVPTVLQTAGALSQTIKQVTDMVKGQKVKGAKIKFPNGMELSVDKASPEELQKLISAMVQK